jgi:ABC-2 type transport system permease protein
MKSLTFAKRCAKEILRDPLNLGFGLGFPLVLLVLLSSMNANIPVNLYEINNLTPGVQSSGFPL